MMTRSTAGPLVLVLLLAAVLGDVSHDVETEAEAHDGPAVAKSGRKLHQSSEVYMRARYVASSFDKCAGVWRDVSAGHFETFSTFIALLLMKA